MFRGLYIIFYNYNDHFYIALNIKESILLYKTTSLNNFFLNEYNTFHIRSGSLNQTVLAVCYL